MTDYFGTWVKLQEQALHLHKQNLDAAFRTMGNTPFDGAVEAARQIGDAQVKAWEGWLALWSPRG
ncbi:hypothetical protein [Sphingomonas crocodyli]|jgi:hypothetical protein|uniref:Phasin family protein n=1 Tax=Sphingomonas crocodyli TaxID=1979270 RepID=A0A437LVK2_9SPHN|nr:hypothetical protein [Sphingomonas crocodyli]RVT89397.1 hypothetical protein EOD43_21770 [Sphingomonas crocodyli]